jgi:hypothetical protein
MRQAARTPSVWLAVLAAWCLGAVLSVGRAAAQSPSEKQPPAERVQPLPNRATGRAQRTDPVVPRAKPVGHGWFAIPGGPGRGTLLMHLPPRGAVGPDGGPAGGRGGSGAAGQTEGLVRFAPGFTQPEEAVAWWHGRVYIALQGDRIAPIGKADWQRRILTLSATRMSGMGGW